MAGLTNPDTSVTPPCTALAQQDCEPKSKHRNPELVRDLARCNASLLKGLETSKIEHLVFNFARCVCSSTFFGSI